MTPALLTLAVVAGAPALKEAPKAPALVGRWVCTALTVSGRADPQWKGLEYEFTADGQWIIYRDGKDIGGVQRKYKSDPAAKPAAIDTCESPDGKFSPGIYKIDGDGLKMSLRTSDGARPATFDPVEGVMTFEFRRVKAKD